MTLSSGDEIPEVTSWISKHGKILDSVSVVCTWRPIMWLHPHSELFAPVWLSIQGPKGQPDHIEVFHFLYAIQALNTSFFSSINSCVVLTDSVMLPLWFTIFYAFLISLPDVPILLFFIHFYGFSFKVPHDPSLHCILHIDFIIVIYPSNS